MHYGLNNEILIHACMLCCSRNKTVSVWLSCRMLSFLTFDNIFLWSNVFRIVMKSCMSLMHGWNIYLQEVGCISILKVVWWYSACRHTKCSNVWKWHCFAISNSWISILSEYKKKSKGKGQFAFEFEETANLYELTALETQGYHDAFSIEQVN